MSMKKGAVAAPFSVMHKNEEGHCGGGEKDYIPAEIPEGHQKFDELFDRLPRNRFGLRIGGNEPD